VSFAQHIAGFIAKLTTREVSGDSGFFDRISEKVTGLTPEIAALKGGAYNTLLQYTNVFSTIAMVAFITALVSLALSPLIRKLMHGEH
jgi:POT family proton-dependent oligopeptide transporter